MLFDVVHVAPFTAGPTRRVVRPQLTASDACEHRHVLGHKQITEEVYESLGKQRIHTVDT